MGCAGSSVSPRAVAGAHLVRASAVRKPNQPCTPLEVAVNKRCLERILGCERLEMWDRGPSRTSR